MVWKELSLPGRSNKSPVFGTRAFHFPAMSTRATDKHMRRLSRDGRAKAFDDSPHVAGKRGRLRLRAHVHNGLALAPESIDH